MLGDTSKVRHSEVCAGFISLSTINFLPLADDPHAADPFKVNSEARDVPPRPHRRTDGGDAAFEHKRAAVTG